MVLLRRSSTAAARDAAMAAATTSPRSASPPLQRGERRPADARLPPEPPVLFTPHHVYAPPPSTLYSSVCSQYENTGMCVWFIFNPFYCFMKSRAEITCRELIGQPSKPPPRRTRRPNTTTSLYLMRCDALALGGARRHCSHRDASYGQLDLLLIGA